MPFGLLWEKMDSNHRRYKPADLQSAPFGHSGILPFLVCKDKLRNVLFLRTFEPMEGFEPTTPRLQITCSGQLSYIGIVFRLLRKSLSNWDCKDRYIFHSCKTFPSFFNIFQELPLSGRRSVRIPPSVAVAWPDRYICPVCR